MSKVIQEMWQKRAPLSEWIEKNPVLGPGEIGVEESTDYFRIGDGVQPFLDLPRFMHEVGVEAKIVALIEAFETGAVTWDTIQDKPATFPPSSHTHDTRYYTETEIDTIVDDLSGTLAPLNHNHDTRYYTETEIDGLIASLPPIPTWTTLAGKPATFPASAHTHDDRYFTEAEVTTSLAGKSDLGHTHDSRYYTEAEIDSIVNAALADEVANRDAAIDAAIAALVNSAPGLLDTLDEIAQSLGDNPDFAGTMTTALAGKQASHALLTALSGLAAASNKLPYFSGSSTMAMTDFTLYARTLLASADAATARGVLSLGTSATLDAPAAGNASAAEVVKGNDSRLSDSRAPTAHTHDDRYYTEAEIAALLAGYSETTHIHDSRYYTETETDALLVGKSDTSHTHDSRYYTETETDALLATKSGTAHDHDSRYYTETEMDAALALKADKSKTVNAQTGTTYTYALTDAGKWVSFNNASAITVTVPPNGTIALPIGTQIEGAQLGAGQVTFAEGVGVTIRKTPGLKIAAQYGSYGLMKIDTNEWVLYGRLAA